MRGHRLLIAIAVPFACSVTAAAAGAAANAEMAATKAVTLPFIADPYKHVRLRMSLNP